MAKFVYKSAIYGAQTFTVADEGGIVELEGRRLSALGGYLLPNGKAAPLRADASCLEIAVHQWWKKRTSHLFALGHKANGVKP